MTPAQLAENHDDHKGDNMSKERDTEFEKWVCDELSVTFPVAEHYVKHMQSERRFWFKMSVVVLVLWVLTIATFVWSTW